LPDNALTTLPANFGSLMVEGNFDLKGLNCYKIVPKGNPQSGLSLTRIPRKHDSWREPKHVWFCSGAPAALDRKLKCRRNFVRGRILSRSEEFCPWSLLFSSLSVESRSRIGSDLSVWDNAILGSSFSISMSHRIGSKLSAFGSARMEAACLSDHLPNLEAQ
jgi:hypothetical protein